MRNTNSAWLMPGLRVPPKKQWRRWVLVGIAAALVFVWGPFVVNDDGFDAQAWQSQRGVGARTNTRAAQVPALSSALRQGMTREEVQRLLGQPDARTQKADIYRMGVAPFGVDQDSYQIIYDQHGKLAAHRLSRG